MHSLDSDVQTGASFPNMNGNSVHSTPAQDVQLRDIGSRDNPVTQRNGVHAASNGHSNGTEEPVHVNGTTEHSSVNGHSSHLNGTEEPVHVNGTTEQSRVNGHSNPSTPEPIAVIGYSCRLPGHVTTPTDLWELCTRARSGWSNIPSDRFSCEAFHHPNPSKIGTFNPTGGYFLQDDVAKFDAPFFKITAQEATSMDPQQRLLLECSFEALESAGLPKEQLAGRQVGVFIGGNFAEYELHNVRDLETAPMFQATGCAPALQSNRLSYYFDLRGPSFTVDTACSGSLVALHQAVQSLRSGESTEALVGGCKLNIIPDLFVTMSNSQ